MYIIAGLGNPGSRYEKTRHNCGFEAIDLLAEHCGISLKDRKFKSLCGNGVIDGQKVLLMKPLTYMNLSGEAVQAAAAFYKIDPAKELIVLYDDISLEPGQPRVRAKGSAGGHNGIRSIIRMLGTEQFLRVKIGTGAKPADMDLADYVLGRIPLSERADMAAAFDRASKAAVDLVTEPLDRVMNEYNRKIEKVPEA